jgi:hypothetical protein
MSLSFGEGVHGIAGGRTYRIPAAAIFGEVGQQLVHGSVFGRVDELAAEPALRDEAGMYELLKVEGKRRRQDTKAIGDHTGRQACRPLRYQQPEHIKPRFLCERPKRGDRAFLLHLADCPI